jgi:hypothetical protein
MFISLAKWIDDLGGGYIEGLIYFLNKYNFPNDSLFKDKFMTFEFYKNKHSSSQVQHIFTEIEKLNNKEIVYDDLSLEHIAPRTMDKKWRKYLGADFENIENIYLHTIGNLTITGYNGELSNNSFENKKKIYKDSNVSLTRDLAKLDAWNLESIKSRAEKLADKAITIWKYRASTIRVEEKEKNVFLSEQEFDFTNCEVLKIIINNQETTELIANWKNACCVIIKYLYDLDGDKFLEQIKTNKYFNKKSYNSPIKLTDDITFEGCFSANQTVNFIKEFIDKFDDYRINCENISFVVKKKK